MNLNLMQLPSWHSFVDANQKTRQTIVDVLSIRDLDELSPDDLATFLEATELSAPQRDQVIKSNEKVREAGKSSPASSRRQFAPPIADPGLSYNARAAMSASTPLRIALLRVLVCAAYPSLRRNFEPLCHQVASYCR
jgi:hypothetical protein